MECLKDVGTTPDEMVHDDHPRLQDGLTAFTVFIILLGHSNMCNQHETCG